MSLFLLCWLRAELNECNELLAQFVPYVRLAGKPAWVSTVLTWQVAPQPLPMGLRTSLALFSLVSPSCEMRSWHGAASELSSVLNWAVLFPFSLGSFPAGLP